MKHLQGKPNDGIQAHRCGESAQVRLVILVFVSFSLGVASGAWWFSHRAPALAASKEIVTVEKIAVPSASASALKTGPALQAPAPPPALASPSVPDAAAVEAVQRAIPNVPGTGLESGTRILRKTAVAEFQQKAEELLARQKELEQNLINGQGRMSLDQQEGVKRKIRELQAAQMEKLMQIAANSKAQIDAFEQLKGAAQ